MPPRAAVKPNRRGARSREIVLDAAERLMAEHGYEAASVARLADEAGIPMSSIYHYFGSKNGVLLAVMERGAERFFDELPTVDRRIGRPLEHLRLVISATVTALEKHPDFLRLLLVLATQPPAGDERTVHEVVDRVRETALRQLREQATLAFDLAPGDPVAEHLARFSLAAFDGAFVAWQTSEDVTLAGTLAHLPDAVVAIRRALGKPVT